MHSPWPARAPRPCAPRSSRAQAAHPAPRPSTPRPGRAPAAPSPTRLRAQRQHAQRQASACACACAPRAPARPRRVAPRARPRRAAPRARPRLPPAACPPRACPCRARAPAARCPVPCRDTAACLTTQVALSPATILQVVLRHNLASCSHSSHNTVQCIAIHSASQASQPAIQSCNTTEPSSLQYKPVYCNTLPAHPSCLGCNTIYIIAIQNLLSQYIFSPKLQYNLVLQYNFFFSQYNLGSSPKRLCTTNFFFFIINNFFSIISSSWKNH